MDAVTKRKPGRPRGSSRYSRSDPELLRRVGDKVLANPGLSTRAAILQVLGKHDSAALRRLQDKLPDREIFVAEARHRAESAARRRTETANDLKALLVSVGYAAVHVNRAIHATAEHIARTPEFGAAVETLRRIAASGVIERAAEMAGRFNEHPVVRQTGAALMRMEKSSGLGCVEEVRLPAETANLFGRLTAARS